MPYQLITSPDQLRQACLLLRPEEFIGLDTETTALDPDRGSLRLNQIASPSHTFILDLHRFAAAGGNPPALDPLGELLSSARPVKVLHNAKFDLKWIRRHLGIEVGGLFDTMLSAQLLDFSARHSLDATLEQYLQIEVDKSLQTSDWSGELSIAQYGYAARDAELLLPLHSELTKLLRREGLERVAGLEFEAVPQIAGLELAGIYVDRTKFEALITSIEGRRVKRIGGEDVVGQMKFVKSLFGLAA